MTVKNRNALLEKLKTAFKALTSQRKSHDYVPGREIIPGPNPAAPPFSGSPEVDEALVKKLSAARKPHANVPFGSE